MLVDAFVRKICVVGIPAIGMPDTQGAEQALCQFFQVIVFTCNIRDRSVGRYLNKRNHGARTPAHAPQVSAHAARTSGFFKVRGININHADFEDFMNRKLGVSDFKVEVGETDTLDTMTLFIELSRGIGKLETSRMLESEIRRVFEVTPKITIIELGTLEKELKDQVKQQRFIDKRG